MGVRGHNPIRAAMRHVDWDACVGSSAWPALSLSPDGFPAPFDSFDLMPHRAAQVAMRRRRSRLGWVAAVASGVLGAAILHGYSVSEQRANAARHERLLQRLAAFGPGLEERKRLETSLTAAAAHDAQLSALLPRRHQVIALLDAVEQAGQVGVAVTAITREDAPTSSGIRNNGVGTQAESRGSSASISASGSGGGGDGGGDGGNGNAGSIRHGSAGLIRVTGLADDADTVARWSEQLAAHSAIEGVELDALRRLADAGRASSRLNVFRMTVRMKDRTADGAADGSVNRAAPNSQATPPSALPAPIDGALQ